MTFYNTTTRNILLPGKPTRVQFHVTVMSLDSIDEGSMVSINTEKYMYYTLILVKTEDDLKMI